MALRKKQKAYLSKVKMCPQKRGKHSTSEKKKKPLKNIDKVIQIKLNIAETNVKSYIQAQRIYCNIGKELSSVGGKKYFC